MRLTRRTIYLLLLAVFLLCTGCSKPALPEKADFHFSLPEGYRIDNATDQHCDIIRTEDETIVGGMEVTVLSKKDLKDTQTRNIMTFLREAFHKTNNTMEYVASNWGKEHPIVSITLTNYSEDRTQWHDFYHIFFEKDACVYHMWFDMEQIALDYAHDFLSITGVDS